jgi:hypothetical protein
MAKARLLQAVCTVALLAAAPAFAQQTTTSPADTGPGNSVNNPVAHDTTTPRAQSNMAPAEKMDSTSGGGSSAAVGSHATHHAMMGHSTGGMHARTDGSQNSAVDQLNDQSFQAAQRGQSFSSSDTGAPGTMTPAGSGSLNDMSGGSSSPASSASGSGGGIGAGSDSGNAK